MIIDCHAHIFPDLIAERAAGSIAKFYDLPVYGDGKLSTLLRLGEEAGITQHVVDSVATTPTQARHINDFIAQTVRENPERLIGFMALHPDQPDIATEVERAAAMGLRGVKIHPDMQRVALDDARMFPMYEAIAGKYPLLAHTGDARYDFSSPTRMARVLDNFPKLTVICAHLGGLRRWDEAREVLAGRGVYVDTSSSVDFMEPEEARKLIRFFGVEHTLFGTDYPMWRPQTALEGVERLKLPAADMERILWQNARELLQ